MKQLEFFHDFLSTNYLTYHRVSLSHANKISKIHIFISASLPYAIYIVYVYISNTGMVVTYEANTSLAIGRPIPPPPRAIHTLLIRYSVFVFFFGRRYGQSDFQTALYDTLQCKDRQLVSTVEVISHEYTSLRNIIDLCVYFYIICICALFYI